jgi:hypothetical protein
MASDQEKELAAPIKAQRLAWVRPGSGCGMSGTILMVVAGNHCAED